MNIKTIGQVVLDAGVIHGVKHSNKVVVSTFGEDVLVKVYHHAIKDETEFLLSVHQALGLSQLIIGALQEPDEEQVYAFGRLLEQAANRVGEDGYRKLALGED